MTRNAMAYLAWSRTKSSKRIAQQGRADNRGATNRLDSFRHPDGLNVGSRDSLDPPDGILVGVYNRDLTGPVLVCLSVSPSTFGLPFTWLGKPHRKMNWACRSAAGRE